MRRGLAGLVVLLLACTLGLRAPAGAQTSGGERIRRFDSTIEVADNGTVTVTEEITYDFGSNQRHGIERTIPVKLPLRRREGGLRPGHAARRWCSSPPTRAPRPSTRRSSSGLDTTLRIGDPDTLITGVHTYRITYRLRGAINHFEDHDELYLNVTGNEWAVPIDEVSATVDGPAPPTQVACFAGPEGSQLPCPIAEKGETVARFGASDLPPYAGLTVVVGFPARCDLADATSPSSSSAGPRRSASRPGRTRWSPRACCSARPSSVSRC